MLSRILPFLLCLIFSSVHTSEAAIDVPAVIGNHAVLQRTRKFRSGEWPMPEPRSR